MQLVEVKLTVSQPFKFCSISPALPPTTLPSSFHDSLVCSGSAKEGTRDWPSLVARWRHTLVRFNFSLSPRSASEAALPIADIERKDFKVCLYIGLLTLIYQDNLTFYLQQQPGRAHAGGVRVTHTHTHVGAPEANLSLVSSATVKLYWSSWGINALLKSSSTAVHKGERASHSLPLPIFSQQVLGF